MTDPSSTRGQQILAVVTSFLALFAIVGVALYGLPRFYPFFVQELGWSRQQVTSGNAYSKIAIAVAFGFIAGRMVDRFGPRRLMRGGIVMAGLAAVGVSYATTMRWFYLFYAFNALGVVCGRAVHQLSCAIGPGATMALRLGISPIVVWRKGRQVLISAGSGLFCGGTQ